MGVNIAVGLDVLLNCDTDKSGPLNTDHNPAPVVGMLPASVAVPVEQIVWVEVLVAVVGVAFTVIVKLVGLPVHVPVVGVTVTVATTSVVPLLAAVNEAIFPEPLAAKPILGVLLTQL